MTNMIVYLIGTLLVVAGLAYAASRMGVSSVWILAGALVIIGIGLMGGIVKTRQKDPRSDPAQRNQTSWPTRFGKSRNLWSSTASAPLRVGGAADSRRAHDAVQRFRHARVARGVSRAARAEAIGGATDPGRPCHR